MTEILTVGINYHKSPLALREIVAISADRVIDQLRQLTRRCHLTEAVILSTCNRTEVYCLSDAPEEVAAWLAEPSDGAASEYIYRLHSTQAVKHLFRVASGLDSQLMGEPEITGQVKQFAQLAHRAGYSGTVINRLMEHALAAAKAVRTQTEIGKHSLSYPALVLRAVAGIFPDLSDVSALFVGAGDMAASGLPIFADKGISRLAVAGRDLHKTQKIADKFSAQAFAIVQLPEIIAEFDVVVSATASQVPIIGKGAVESALRRRHHKPMVFADLAIPRDLEVEIQQLPDVFVYNLDQFAAMAMENNEKRHLAARHGEMIVEEHTDRFCRWLAEYGTGTGARVRGFRELSERIQREEVRAALARLTAGVAPQRVVEDIARRLTGRLLHTPTQCARQNTYCSLHQFEETEQEMVDNTRKRIDESVH